MERRSEGKRDKMRRDNETYGEERRTSVMVVIRDIKELKGRKERCGKRERGEGR